MNLWIGGLSAILIFGCLLVLVRMSRFTEIQGFSLRHRLWLYGFSIVTTTFGIAQIFVAASKDRLLPQELILTASLTAIVGFIVIMPIVLTWPGNKRVEDQNSTVGAPLLEASARYKTPPEQEGLESGNLLPELLRVIQRFERALTGSKITIFTQDRDLSYTWIHNPPPGFGAASILGQKDHQILPLETALPIIEAKRRALEDEQTEQLEAVVEIAGAEHFFEVRIEPMYDGNGKLDGIISIAVDNTERRKTESQLRLMMREVNHRSKNLLAVIQAIARQTAAHAAHHDDFVDSFIKRLQALAQSHDLLVHEAWRGGSLVDLIDGQIGHQLHAKKSQLILIGSDVRISVDATQHIGLALHELATNAAKYGALSVPEGRVKICWRKIEDDNGAASLKLRWSESEGPRVMPQMKKGFGHTILKRITSHALDAEVKMDFAPDGLSWELHLPWQHVVE